MFVRGASPPPRQLLWRRIRVHPALGRLERVHHPQRPEPFLLLVAEAPRRRRRSWRTRSRRRGSATCLADSTVAFCGHSSSRRRASVDVPVERRAQVRRRGVLRLVQRDRVDPRRPGADRPPSGRSRRVAAERHLGFGIRGARPGNTSTPLSSSASSTAAPSDVVGRKPVRVDAVTSAPTESVSLFRVSKLIVDPLRRRESRHRRS